LSAIALTISVVITFGSADQVLDTNAVPRVARAVSNDLARCQWPIDPDPSVDVRSDVLALEPEVGIALVVEGVQPEMAFTRSIDLAVESFIGAEARIDTTCHVVLLGMM